MVSENDVLKLEGKKPVAPKANTSSRGSSKAKPTEKKANDKLRYKTTTTSIKSAFSTSVNSGSTQNQDGKDNEAEEIQEVIQGSDSFTEEQIKEAWISYADELENQPRMRNTILGFSPKLIDNQTLKLKLMNAAQVEVFNSKIKPGILNFVRRRLNNGQIELFVEVGGSGELKNRKALTAEDKLKEFIKKNPAIGQLKQRFNLDID